ncbi:MAG: hypothetical protein HOP23_14485 [Methylococcaceae bacterium]|nr:hypothetical protein [Methylococcaceae bacterium]
MTEVLFILTTIFVAYVIYVVVSEQKSASKSEVHQAKAESPVTTVKQTPPQPAPKTENVAEVIPVAAAAVTSKPVTPTTKPASPAPVVAAPDAGKKGLKDPKTGEVATTYGNYRFTKRWIKEALVAEGLLEKIYKNDELNADTEARIKGAILKLEENAKYRA